MYVIKMGKKLADILRIVGWKYKIKGNIQASRHDGTYL